MSAAMLGRCGCRTRYSFGLQAWGFGTGGTTLHPATVLLQIPATPKPHSLCNARSTLSCSQCPPPPKKTIPQHPLPNTPSPTPRLLSTSLHYSVPILAIPQHPATPLLLGRWLCGCWRCARRLASSAHWPTPTAPAHRRDAR